MTLSKRSYALVNGLNMYYEIHGEGQPLVLLHGALSAIGASFSRVLPQLSSTGRSSPLNSKLMGTLPTLIGRSPTSRWLTTPPHSYSS